MIIWRNIFDCSCSVPIDIWEISDQRAVWYELHQPDAVVSVFHDTIERLVFVILLVKNHKKWVYFRGQLTYENPWCWWLLWDFSGNKEFYPVLKLLAYNQ